MRVYESLTSTNSEAARIADELSHGETIVALEQTAGRGQRGNTWEAEPYKNLTFTMLLRPDSLRAADSFSLSMAVALGVADAVAGRLFDPDISVKWPNDIYWRDKKIAGILIENALTGGMVKHSIVGIGLNVNQSNFMSDAPNPVSMSQINGCEFDIFSVLEDVEKSILYYVDTMLHAPNLIDIYMSRLWRRHGLYAWREPSGEQFVASIEKVEQTGHLTLRLEDNTSRRYIFKEIHAVI